MVWAGFAFEMITCVVAVKTNLVLDWKRERERESVRRVKCGERNRHT